MPWDVRRDTGRCPDGKPWAVIKRADGELEGCHESEEAAKRQQAALYASEERMRMGTDQSLGAKFRAGFGDEAITTLEKALEEGATEAVVPIKIAAYDAPDTKKPVGVKERQVLDMGCFRGFCSRFPGADPVPLFIDHGNAIMQSGWPSTTLLVGRGDSFRESLEDRGLVVEAAYNLRKQIGKDAVSDILFNPRGTRYSFRWDHHETYRGDDGFEHVRDIPEITEFSQMGFGSAQADTGPVGPVQYRAAIPSHSTGTSEGSWDASSQVSRLSNDAGASMYRRMFAYVDPDGDPDAKSSYGFPHHEVGDGRVGAANLTACSAGIAALNGARGGSNLTGAERRGVYNHLAAHLRAAGRDVPDLKTRMPAAEEFAEWADDEEFRSLLVAVVKDHDPLVRAMREDADLRAKILADAEGTGTADGMNDSISEFYEKFEARRFSPWEARAEGR